MMKCEQCQDRKVIKQGKSMVDCPYCVTGAKLIGSLTRAVADAKKERNDEMAHKLSAVLRFLPDYPVMAILECEALNMNPNLILMIRDSFGVLPFGDVVYSGEHDLTRIAE
jgi:hypothetical protein